MSDEEMNGGQSPAEAEAATSLTLDDFLGAPDDWVEMTLSAQPGKGGGEAIARFRQITPDTLRDYKNLLTGHFGRKNPNQKAAFDLIVDKCFVEFIGFEITDPELHEKHNGVVKAWLKRSKRGQHVVENIIPTYIGMITPSVEEKN